MHLRPGSKEPDVDAFEPQHDCHLTHLVMAQKGETVIGDRELRGHRCYGFFVGADAVSPQRA